MTSWLGNVTPNPQSRLRLFCFPYAGGGASIYQIWVRRLPATIDLYPIQLPGRENRLSEPPFGQLSLLVQAAAQALLPYLDMPFAFFGHSMGAMIAFELARELRRMDGPSPTHLFVSGRWSPQTPNHNPPTYNLQEEEFLKELRRLNGTPTEVLEHPELRQLVIPILRADFKVCETYQYAAEPPLDCPISAFGGISDPDVSLQGLQDWQAQTNNSFTLNVFPGDHFFLHTAQTSLLNVLSHKLQRIVGEGVEGVVP